jgi:hypothetical protein
LPRRQAKALADVVTAPEWIVTRKRVDHEAIKPVWREFYAKASPGCQASSRTLICGF